MGETTGRTAMPHITCLAGAAISAGFGAAAAAAVSLIGNDGSGFLAFILPGAAFTGLAAGAISFSVGALTYRVLCNTVNRWWTRVGAVIAATVSCAIVVTVPFVIIPATNGALPTAGIAASIAALCAALALRPMEKATGKNRAA
ncbi:MAG: hypothetical protein B5766_12400 [Candidatus Lumbricidophila eiseniae]|uniref:Uncharacterized protein n=1 Tax=Candidatus Lumbricidiphila eiseniae TaxID=1969409 RepID=A0A2A6FNH3_9MICO|nr:MAG: hypothetical protein B5766_12400 [Candidatus Lumbricidophila eiseniae]